MQFDLQKAFPYPVLRPGVNDYTDGEFQSVIEFTPSPNKPAIEFNVQFALSVDEIKELISRKKAQYTVVVACRDTYLRRVFSSPKATISAAFDSGELRGEVQVFPYVVANDDIQSFHCPLINSEFGTGPFAFESGSVIAVDEPKLAYVDRDLFKPITSVFELVKNDNIQGPEWHIDFSGERVRISVAPNIKEKIDKFRVTSRNRAILLNSIYFAAVMQSVRHIAEGEYDDHRWAQVIRQQCHNHNLDPSRHDEYYVAEQLMKLPLGLLDTYVFQEVSE